MDLNLGSDQSPCSLAPPVVPLVKGSLLHVALARQTCTPKLVPEWGSPGTAEATLAPGSSPRLLPPSSAGKTVDLPPRPLRAAKDSLLKDWVGAGGEVVVWHHTGTKGWYIRIWEMGIKVGSISGHTLGPL